MLGHPVYSPCVIRAAKAVGVPLWVGLSALVRADGELGTWTNEEGLFAEALTPIMEAVRECSGCHVMGLMHTKVDVLTRALPLLKPHWSGPCMAYPDCLPFRKSAEEALDLSSTTLTEEEFCTACSTYRDSGVQVLGGCCGTGANHIAALARGCLSPARL